MMMMMMEKMMMMMIEKMMGDGNQGQQWGNHRYGVRRCCRDGVA